MSVFSHEKPMVISSPQGTWKKPGQGPQRGDLAMGMEAPLGMVFSGMDGRFSTNKQYMHKYMDNNDWLVVFWFL